MNKWIWVFVAFMFSGEVLSNEDCQSVNEAEIYFVPWSIQFKRSQTAESVRSEKFFYAKISGLGWSRALLNKVKGKKIDFKKFKEEDIDVRLVIDFHCFGGGYTVVSDGDFIYFLDDMSVVKVDSSIKSEFDINLWDRVMPFWGEEIELKK